MEGVFGVKEVVRQWRKRSSKSELAGSSEDEEQEIESRYYIKTNRICENRNSSDTKLE